ncbi:hypothetical protein KC717_01805 [Candidatus Dojkabacteria bacterium]|uniref:Uncharacterized protein n=1 Tax=Candidatus Dojkabacteria bacterium TaxID=2099670 RepID=A0A955RKG8_9BACT|nr:hypothetical protein [Candidatus Dojkabacteria bacterium]
MGTYTEQLPGPGGPERGRLLIVLMGLGTLTGGGSAIYQLVKPFFNQSNSTQSGGYETSTSTTNFSGEGLISPDPSPNLHVSQFIAHKDGQTVLGNPINDLESYGLQDMADYLNLIQDLGLRDGVNHDIVVTPIVDLEEGNHSLHVYGASGFADLYINIPNYTQIPQLTELQQRLEILFHTENPIGGIPGEIFRPGITNQELINLIPGAGFADNNGYKIVFPGLKSGQPITARVGIDEISILKPNTPVHFMAQIEGGVASPSVLKLAIRTNDIDGNRDEDFYAGKLIDHSITHFGGPQAIDFWQGQWAHDSINQQHIRHVLGITDSFNIMPHQNVLNLLNSTEGIQAIQSTWSAQKAAQHGFTGIHSIDFTPGNIGIRVHFVKP